MESKELYPELADYILNYCGRMNDKEGAAYRHKIASERFAYANKIRFHKYQNEEQYLSSDEAVLKLLENGYENFKLSVAKRICNEHKNELELNLCPKCKKIARTPWAEQCRICLHSWRKKVQ